MAKNKFEAEFSITLRSRLNQVLEVDDSVSAEHIEEMLIETIMANPDFANWFKIVEEDNGISTQDISVAAQVKKVG